MKLSILIPACNEHLLQKTIDDLIENIQGDTEILVGLDGYEPEPPLIHNSDKKVPVGIAKTDKRIGQRAMTNLLARSSKAEYVMKIDAHCSFSKGFDLAMMAKMDDRTILAPLMGVLEPESWTINGRKMVSRYCFDTNFVMQYDKEILENDVETMCLQGSAWMISRENYWKWNICDESLGSWGCQAVELGLKAFLNNGRCVTTRDAYYGHVFRHSDIDFPYDRGEDPGKKANEELRKLFMTKKLTGLVEKFNFPADWTPENLARFCIDR